MNVSPDDILPEETALAGTLVGRLVGGRSTSRAPRPVVLRGDGVFDLTGLSPTIADLLDLTDVAARVAAYPGERLCGVEAAVEASFAGAGPRFLAPCDLQAIKAAGVTFADSLVERVIEERAKGDPSLAAKLRDELGDVLGADLVGLTPGSPAAADVKAVLVREGLWSQYLEVGIGPDAEVFTKAQPMSAVGLGAEVGLHPKSVWNNPEPEVVLACSSRGEIVGATLGNDVNLRDFEGRSALLLSKAKDNNASCAIGPFIRLFDASFSSPTISAPPRSPWWLEGHRDNFRLEGVSSMDRISRDPTDLGGADAQP